MSELKEYKTAIFDNARWRNFESRPNDIFVCTPAKCGTTWVQTIVANMIHPEGVPVPIFQLCPWIEANFLSEEIMHESLKAQTHRRMMKSHTAADGIPWFPESKYIFVARDGLDAFMSWANHVERMKHLDEINKRAAAAGIPQMPDLGDGIHDFFKQWVADEGRFFQIIASYWVRKSQTNLMMLHYNDLKKDLAGEVRRIAKFLDIELSDQHFADVVERSSFTYMREHPEMLGDNLDDFFEGGVKGFIFKGTNGRWRDVLSEDEVNEYQKRRDELLPQDAIDWLVDGRLG